MEVDESDPIFNTNNQPVLCANLVKFVYECENDEILMYNEEFMKMYKKCFQLNWTFSNTLTAKDLINSLRIKYPFDFHFLQNLVVYLDEQDFCEKYAVYKLYSSKFASNYRVRILTTKPSKFDKSMNLCQIL